MSGAALLFPGQGAQRVGMGRDVADVSAAAAEVFAQANEFLGFDLRELCFSGPAERLEATDIQQPAIFVTSVALWRAWQEAGPRDVAVTAGLSLGEYTALHVAGSLSFDDALRLLKVRGQAMQEAARAVDSTMVSVMGLTESDVAAVCGEAAGDEVLTTANFNCPQQVVISGHRSACERAAGLIEQRGGRATPLKVAGAFHSPLMQPAADRLRVALAEVEFKTPTVRVLANVDAEDHTDPDRIRTRLEQQVTQPVLWQRSMERLIADGVEAFYEIGPGRVLTGLMRRIDRKKKVVNVSTVAALEEGVPA